MKKLALFIFCFSSLCAEELTNQIYFGPEWLVVHLDTNVEEIRVKGHKNLVGFRVGYEYLQPWVFYAGIDALSVIGSQGFYASQNDLAIHSTDQPTGFLNVDLRLGYATAVCNWSFVPFLGTGLYSLGSIVDRGFREGWLYLSGGLRSTWQINPVFALGLNLKTSKAILSYEKFSNHTVSAAEHPFPWSAELGIPFVWNFNPQRTWIFQLEPYWLKLDFSEQQDIFGAKFLIRALF